MRYTWPFFLSLEKCLRLCAQVSASAEDSGVKLQQNTHTHTQTPILFLVPPTPALRSPTAHRSALYQTQVTLLPALAPLGTLLS